MTSTLSHPRLKRQYHIVPLEDGRVQLRSFYRSVMLKPSGGAGLVARLLPLLDGTSRREELAALAGGGAADVERVLRVLEERGLLEDGASADDGASSWFRAQRVFFGAVSVTPDEHQQRLAEARVLVIGAGTLAAPIARQLLQSNVGHVARLPLTASVEPMLDPPGVDQLAGGCIDAGQPALESLLREYDIAIFCNHSYAIAGARAVNAAARAHRVPWLYVGLQGEDAVIGPLVLPGQTACLTCYEMRMKGNMMFAEEYVAFESYLLTHREGGHEQGHLIPYLEAAAGIASSEAVRFLTRHNYPMSLGRLLRFNFKTYAMAAHPVLRVPRCVTCCEQRPVAREWELVVAGV